MPDLAGGNQEKLNVFPHCAYRAKDSATVHSSPNESAAIGQPKPGMAPRLQTQPYPSQNTPKTWQINGPKRAPSIPSPAPNPTRPNPKRSQPQSPKEVVARQTKSTPDPSNPQLQFEARHFEKLRISFVKIGKELNQVPPN
jgi:hypothetical protein